MSFCRYYCLSSCLCGVRLPSDGKGKLMEHVTALDIVIIFAYLLAMLGIGFYFMRRVKTSKDYYVAGRTLGPFVLMATVCASIIGGGALIGKGGYAYTGGMLSVAIAAPYMVGMFFFSSFSGRISDVGKKYNLTSIPELMEYRFGRTVKIVAAIMIAYSMASTVAGQISATATVFNVVGGKFGITYIWGAVIATVIFVVYTASSGLFGVVYTDVVQFVVLLVTVFIMLPIKSIGDIGGLGELIRQTPAEKWNFTIDASTMTLLVTNFVMTIAGAEFWQRAFAAKDRKSALKGQFRGTSIYAVSIVITLFLGLSAAILMPNLIEEYGTADYAVPVLVAQILPSGLTGLAFAGLLSVMMSTADSCMLCSTQAIAYDIGKTIKPDMSEKQELLLSRVSTVVIAGAAFAIALFIKSAYDALMFAWVFYAAVMGLPCLAALFWRKATKAGMLSGMGAGLVTSIAWKIAGEPLGLSATVLGIICCGVALVAVSLLTYKKHPTRFVEVKKGEMDALPAK